MKKRHHAMPLALLCGAIALSLFPLGAARSQDGVDARNDARSSVAAGIGTPTTLLAALEGFKEDGKDPKNGCLLAVDPIKAAPVPQASSPTDTPEESADSLEAIAQRFGRLLSASGPVTTLIPPKMVLLNPDPGTPNIYEGLDAASKMRLLMGTLTPAQWQQLGGANGLGADELSPEQSLLFLSLLPEPFCIRRVVAGEDGYQWGDTATRRLSPEARTQVRLRLSLASDIRPIPAQLGQGITIMGDSIRPPGTSFLTLDDNARAEQSAGKTGWGAYGITLRAEAANEQKPSDLDFDRPALAASVTLKPGPGEPLTVGEIVRRAGAVSHLEMYADRRIASLPVWSRGAAAPAANLIRALCLSVTGTFRKVGPAFVLTDDVAGIAARRAALQDWLETAKAQQIEMLMALQEHHLSKPLLSSLSFSPDDPLAADASTTGKVLAGYTQIYSGDYQATLNTLPAEKRAVYQSCVDNALKQEQPVRTDVVAVNVNLRMTYRVPGEGEVSALQPDLGSLLGFVQPSYSELMRALPAASAKFLSLAALPNRSLCVTPGSEEEAIRAIDAAKAGGFHQVWIKLPADGGTAPLLAAISRGKKKGVAVSAVVSLFRQAAGKPDADQNVLGKTSASYDASRLQALAGLRHWQMPFDPSPDDWSEPSAATFERQKRRLTALAGTPGLAGIVLRDTAAPGYETPTPDANPFAPDQFQAAAPPDMGYTEGLRLAFLRRNGLDPVDVTARPPQTGLPLNDSDLSLPFFPDDPSGMQQWKAFRGEINARHMALLFAAVHPLVPRLPLLIGERSGATAWFSVWDTPRPLPLGDAAQFAASAHEQARQTPRYLLKNIAVTNESISAPDYAQYVRSVFTSAKPGPWNGIVCDLSALSLGKAIDLVNECFQQPPSQK